MLRALLLFVIISVFNEVADSRDVLNNQSSPDSFIYVDNGRLYHPDGREVALWGVNLQPMVSWEYNSLMKKVGMVKDAASWKKMVDEGLDEIKVMNCKVWRAHLTPADFTDATGNLVETIYLDLLDYTVAEAAKRGIYCYITFLNHMGNYEVAESFMQTLYQRARQISVEENQLYTSALLMFDGEALTFSRNYLKKLLNRTNPYSNTPYRSDTSIVLWEIMNEPTYMSYDQLKLYVSEYTRYQTWLADSGWTEENGLHYPAYRKQRVLDYIDGMYDAVKEGGAKQPVAWNCNWHRMINGREDVFEAIAESKMEVVSFCNYPGQSIPVSPYWANPIDLTGYNFTNWYRDCYNNRDWYGWAREPRFAGKAKIVYEFETFYNQSAYLYPVMADFFRAMGVQVATMWHYSFLAYAPWRNGSHMLNLKCTPGKAASFVVASKLFESTPLSQPYNTNSTTERVAEKYMYSFKKNLSIYSSGDDYIYSGTLPGPESPAPHQSVKHILGYGSSALVKYCGTGVYDIKISDSRVDIHIEPNSGWLREPWQNDGLKYLVTELDYDGKHFFELRLEGWEGKNCTLSRMEDGEKVPYSFIGGKLMFEAIPGDYVIERN